MSHSNVANLIHLVWATHRRKNTIPEAMLDPLWEYFVGIGYNKDIPVIAAGGIPNHVHLAIQLPPTMTLSYAISVFKANSSRWLKQQGASRDFSWQTGYGAFSFGKPQLEQVKRYILNQAKHHKKNTFEEEFLDLLKRAGVDYDPRRVFE